MHLLKIEEIQHLDVDGTVLWEQKDVENIFHQGGQEFILGAAFNTASYSVPSNYYLGLDNRTTPALADTLSSLSGEPTQNGYARVAISSANGFTISVSASNYRALSAVATFSASGGQWGPVKNLFLTTTALSSGYLISTAVLDTERTLLDGQSMSLRINVSLVNC